MLLYHTLANGRGNNQYLGELVKTELKNRGKDPVDLRTENDPSSFYAAIGEAKQKNKHGAFVTQHEVDEYANMQLFLDDTKGVGVAVTADGDIVSVFKNPKINPLRGLHLWTSMRRMIGTTNGTDARILSSGFITARALSKLQKRLAPVRCRTCRTSRLWITKRRQSTATACSLTETKL